MDANIDTLQIDDQLIEARITPKTKAIMIARDETRHPETEYQQKDVGKETYAQKGKDERAVGQLIAHY